ncbi:lipase 3-like [Apis laboriosa]|uniref:lipase 3-like n=1 Tax=Apis laboriosa TaxID=183418 RepID=UPI001CC52DA3|nr:lipase 3-like [Apis laboriosa]
MKMLKISYILFCVLPLILAIPFTEQENELHENLDSIFDKVLSPEELIRKEGYTAETHQIVTEDRYILNVHRISESPKSSTKNKPAVLLIHGVFDCSATWLIPGPGKGLGFLLADLGYDVWMINVRGNRYARRHLDMNISDKNYWNFSWHEIGVYDIPATIDYILKKTKKEKIFIISHSQGGSAFFVMASERPEYQNKIIASFSMAPAVFMSRTNNPLFQILAPFSNDIKCLTKLIGLYEFKPSNKLIQMLGKKMCKDGELLQPICQNIVFLFGGIDKELNTTLLSLITQYDPAGSSVNQFVHFAQSIHSGKFRKYDYGIGNLKKYGKIYPPDYELAKIKIPVYLYYGANDIFINVEDLNDLYKALPNAQKFLVPSKTFAHLDFVWGKHVDVLVYNQIFAFMERYKKEQLI